MSNDNEHLIDTMEAMEPPLIYTGGTTFDGSKTYIFKYIDSSVYILEDEKGVISISSDRLEAASLSKIILALTEAGYTLGEVK